MPKKDAAVKKAAAAAQAAVGNRPDAEAPKKPVVKTSAKSPKLTQSLNEVAAAVSATYDDYVNTLTPRLKLIDCFLVFLVLLGALQFIYVLLIGNFPFNAFLGGFISCVGQFVLTVSLRLQYATPDTKEVEKVERPFATISPERALGDYVFASLILHFIVFHFIN